MSAKFDYDKIVLPSIGVYGLPKTANEKKDAFKMAVALRYSTNPLVKRFYWSVYNTNKEIGAQQDKKEHPELGPGFFGYTQKCLWNVGIRWIGGDRNPKEGVFNIKEVISIDLVAAETLQKIQEYFFTGPDPSTGLTPASDTSDDDDDEVEVVLVVKPVKSMPKEPMAVAVPVAAHAPAPVAEVRLCDHPAYLKWLDTETKKKEHELALLKLQMKRTIDAAEKQVNLRKRKAMKYKIKLGELKHQKWQTTGESTDEDTDDEPEYRDMFGCYWDGAADYRRNPDDSDTSDDEVSDMGFDFNNDDDVIADAFADV